jgi:hypothetical protein
MGTESEPLNTEKPIRLCGRSTHTGRLMPLVLLAVAFGMQVMFLLFAAGAPIWLVLPALLAMLFAVMAPFLRHINFSLESGGSWFKLFFILFPGTAYLLYRSFIRKDPT